MINKKLIAFPILMSLVGCASVMNETSHPIRFDTLTSDGQSITGADCVATNDKGFSKFRSGETVAVRRSSKDLDIKCSHPGQPDAQGRATSRVNSGMFGNIIIGGGIGAIIDHTKGTAYTYPAWIQLIFGQTRTYDRRDDHDGKPVTGEFVGNSSNASSVN